MTDAGRGRPRVAVIATTWHENSHADVIAGRIIQGYDYQGEVTEARIEVASVYMEQRGVQDPSPRPDVGIDLLNRHGVPVFPTVAEALGLGSAGVRVDGVVIIGEHGDFELNEFGQKLYPRRRLFDAALSAMIGAGRFVPIFVDKQLSWSTPDARAMYETSRRLGVPLLAGSSVPLAERFPAGADWPYGAVMEECLSIGFGEAEAYGFHALEAAQAIAERRHGGETGVVAVRGFRGDAARERLVRDESLSNLLADALAAGTLEYGEAVSGVNTVFEVHHADGLRQWMVMTDAAREFSVAARGPQTRLAFAVDLGAEESTEFAHFTWLVRQIESLFLEGVAPYPVERTLLTGGVLATAMRSGAQAGREQDTDDLMIAYRVDENIPDTGHGTQIKGAT